MLPTVPSKSVGGTIDIIGERDWKRALLRQLARAVRVALEVSWKAWRKCTEGVRFYLIPPMCR